MNRPQRLHERVLLVGQQAVRGIRRRPTDSATALAVSASSPVSITTRRTPCARNNSIASRAVSRARSSHGDRARAARRRPQRRWPTGQRLLRGTDVSLGERNPARLQQSPIANDGRPPTYQRFGAEAWKRLKSRRRREHRALSRLACATIARAIGCSDRDSTAAANRSTSLALAVPTGSTVETVSLPVVRVPVLSNAIVPTSASRSRYAPPLTRTPLRAAAEAPTRSRPASR